LVAGGGSGCVAAARCGAAGFVVGQIREMARRQRHATPTLCRLGNRGSALTPGGRGAEIGGDFNLTAGGRSGRSSSVKTRVVRRQCTFLRAGLEVRIRLPPAKSRLRTSRGFGVRDPNQTPRQPREERDDLAAAQPFAKNALSRRVDAVDLKNVFRRIQSNCLNVEASEETLRQLPTSSG